MVREARKEDLDELLRLYLFLHEDSVPKHDTHNRFSYKTGTQRKWSSVSSV